MAESTLRNALITGIPFGLAMGATITWSHGLVAGVACGAGAGVLFGAAIAAFIRAQAAKAISGELAPGEPIRHQGPANHLVPGDAAGGRLYLTDRRLYFKSHGLNRKDHELTVELANIAGAEPGRTLGLIPNKLVVRRRDGGHEVFVVGGRAAWVAAIGGRSPR